VPTRHVLIVDPNAAFAEILRESLEQAGAYAVSVVDTGEAAIARTQSDAFHLAVIDTMLADIEPSDLLAALREIDPFLRIAFIPPFGEELDHDLVSLDIQGILHKPFILQKLDDLVQSFLQQEVVTAPPSRADVVRGYADEIRPLMEAFQREVSARVAALICEEELISYTGRPPYEHGDPLVHLILDNFEVSDRLAAFLDEPNGHFALTSYVGDKLSLYALAFDDGLALVTVPGDGIPPGVVHLAIKRVVEGISELLATAFQDAGSSEVVP
jgi:CheY-like chemotaxis protein